MTLSEAPWWLAAEQVNKSETQERCVAFRVDRIELLLKFAEFRGSENRVTHFESHFP